MRSEQNSRRAARDGGVGASWEPGSGSHRAVVTVLRRGAHRVRVGDESTREGSGSVQTEPAIPPGRVLRIRSTPTKPPAAAARLWWSGMRPGGQRKKSLEILRSRQPF